MLRPCLVPVTAAALLTLLASSRASAAHPFPDTNHYLPIGLTIGGAIHPHIPNGFLIGSELSYARLDPDDQGWWVGGYVDGLWDGGADAFRFTTGPEFGWGPFGVDGGYVGQANKLGYFHGAAVRPFLSLSFITLAGRYVHLFGDAPDRDFGEIAILLKVPIPLGVKPRRWLNGPQPEPPPPPPPPPPRRPKPVRRPLHVAVPPPAEQPLEVPQSPAPPALPEPPPPQPE